MPVFKVLIVIPAATSTGKRLIHVRVVGLVQQWPVFHFEIKNIPCTYGSKSKLVISRLRVVSEY
jgi:hypothetical protein